MKKIISIILLLILCVTLTACAGDGNDPGKTPPTQPDNGNVVTPIKPGGDFNIGGNYGN